MDDLFDQTTETSSPLSAQSTNRQITTAQKGGVVSEDDRKGLEESAEIVDNVGSFSMDYLEGSHLGRSLKGENESTS